MNKFLFNILLVLCLVASSAAEVSAEQKSPGEYQIKALFLYNFLNFVDWPAESSFYSSPTINVCIIGDDPFGNSLDEIRNETVKGKKLAIRFYTPFEEPRKCHLLFIPASEKSHVGQILRTVRESDVLTVSDTLNITGEGAIISFYMEQKKVRFAINIGAARRVNLKISAKLLKLAKIINGEED